jgi:hypothetical protein
MTDFIELLALVHRCVILSTLVIVCILCNFAFF